MRRLGFGIVLIGLAVAAFVAFRFVHGWTETGPAMKDITLVVPEGSTIADAAILLKQKGAVRSADAFLTRAKVFGRGKSIKAGEFLIPKGASNSDIFRILQGGRTLTRLITIPEGMPSRSEEHTSELQSLMRISYAVFCLTKKKNNNTTKTEK